METSQAIVLPPVQPPLYSRPEGCDCLLPRLGALAYQTIDSENGDIRLVELLPGRYSDVVQMNLHTKNLGDKPNYEALSYAWGTTPSSNRAIINGCPVPVRESLDLGLRRLRLADQPRMLWIDAVCINQKDEKERGHQVAMMRSVYSKADCVRIWINEPGLEEESKAMAAFRSFELGAEESRFGLGDDLKFWEPLEPIFKNGYWRRLWM